MEHKRYPARGCKNLHAGKFAAAAHAMKTLILSLMRMPFRTYPSNDDLGQHVEFGAVWIVVALFEALFDRRLQTCVPYWPRPWLHAHKQYDAVQVDLTEEDAPQWTLYFVCIMYT